MALEHHQVDVVEVTLTTETVGQVVLRVHRRSKLFALGTLKPEVTVALLRNRAEFAHPSDRQLHR